jgi:hypothetical protein
MPDRWRSRADTDDHQQFCTWPSERNETARDPGTELDPAFFPGMVDTVGVDVAIYGSDDRYIYVNDAYAGLFSTDPSALVSYRVRRRTRGPVRGGG